MAAGDLALKILVTVEARAVRQEMTAIANTVSGAVTGLGSSLRGIYLGLQNLGTGGTAAFDMLKADVLSLAGSLTVIGITIAAVATALALILGVVAVKAAGDFQQGLNRLKTGAGDVTDNLNTLGKGIMQISTDTGATTSDLLSAMYTIVSSGLRGQQALDALSASAKGAEIEQANIVDVAKAVTAAMTNFGTAQFGATQYMNGLIVAVQHGKVTLEELSANMGPLEAVAHDMGISFSDLAAAFTVQTNAGIPAARAATGLRFLMQSLENPTAKAEKAFKSLGLSSIAVGNELKVSLPGALQMIYDAAKKAGPEGSVPFNRAISDMIGGQRSITAFLSLTGSHMQSFSADAKMIGDAMKSSQGGILGWQTALSNWNVEVDRAKAAIGTFMIQLGTQLLPVFQQLLTLLVPLIINFLQWAINSGIIRDILQGLVAVISFLINVGSALISFFQNNEVAMDALKATLIVVAFVVGVVLVAAFLILTAAVWGFTVALLANPLTWIVLAIIAVITLVILAVTHWSDIMKFLGGIFSWLGTVAHDVVTTIGGWFSWLGAVAHAVLTASLATIGALFSMLGSTVHGFITGVKNTVGGWFSGLGTAAHNAVNAVAGWFIWLGTQIGKLPAEVMALLTRFFTWLYNHNYYFKDFVDGAKLFFATIGVIFSAVGTFAHTAITAVGNFFSGLGTLAHNALTGTGAAFSALGTTAQNIWSPIQTAGGNFFSWLGTQAHNGTTTVGGWFSALGTTAQGIWSPVQKKGGDFFSWLGTQAHNAVTGTQAGFSIMAAGIGASWDWVKTHVGGVFSAIGTFFHDTIPSWLKMALDAGGNLVKMLIKGLMSNLGALADAAKNVAGQLWKNLGFHSPTEEGPGSTADQWMPNLINMMASGLLAGVPKVAGASKLVAAALAPVLVPSTPSAFASANTGFGLSATGNQGFPDTINMQISMDGKTITQAVGVRMAREMRIQAGVRNN